MGVSDPDADRHRDQHPDHRHGEGPDQRIRRDDPAHGLSFEFLADPLNAPGPTVMTGHDNGLITIALVEADDAEREKRRTALGAELRAVRILAVTGPALHRHQCATYKRCC